MEHRRQASTHRYFTTLQRIATRSDQGETFVERTCTLRRGKGVRMFVSRAPFHAAPGQAPALRDLLLGTVAPDNPVVVAQRLFGEVPRLVVPRAFESLDAYSSWRDTWRPNPAVGGQFPTLPRAAPSSELWEVPGLAGGGPISRFSSRITYTPAAGKNFELREVIQAWVDARRAAGRTSSLWLQVTGGPFAISVVTGFDSLGAFEKMRAQNLSDPAVRKLVHDLAPLVAAPVEAPDLFEIIARPA
jgi:hypothetical protein